MNVLLALAIGTTFGIAVLWLLRGSLWSLLLGLALLGHASHLLIFVGGGLAVAAPPLVAEGALAPAAGAADPLPQALVLTAIVIAFAILAFALVLAVCAGDAANTDDLDAYGGESQ